MDQYSYLHFASGIIFYFFGVKLRAFIILHILFEILENTMIGRNFITNYLTFWPGGKPKSDTFINSVFDIIFSIIGWVSAYYLDKLGKKYGWYRRQ